MSSSERVPKNRGILDDDMGRVREGDGEEGTEVLGLLLWESEQRSS